MSPRLLTVALALCAAMCMLCSSRASALTEFCPARVLAMAPIGAADATGQLYSYALTALGPRSVSGTVIFKTSEGWFQAQFPMTPLQEYSRTYEGKSATFKRTTYESPLLYVHVAPGVVMQAAFVSEARTSGDTTFGWDAHGDVTCQAPPDFETASASAKEMPRERETRAYNTPPDADTPIEVPTITSAPGLLDCAQPFRSVAATRPVIPTLPGWQMSQINFVAVDIAVAVGADGAIQDAWIENPSGFDAYDKEALRAARLSKYRGGTSFCEPAPGMFIFHAESRRVA